MPRIGPNQPWGVERAGTTAYPQWLHAATGVRDEVQSMLASEEGNLQYWIRVPKGAKGTVVVAVDPLLTVIWLVCVSTSLPHAPLTVSDTV